MAGEFATPVGEAPLPETDAHILVVEDDPVTRAKLVGYFESEGYRVSEAEDGQSMWPLLSGQPVDLVLLDVNLPGEDGLYLTRQLRAQFNFGIILVTGRTDDVDRIVGLEIGADDYVTKPFNQRELLARVKNILRRIPDARGADAGLKHFAAWVFDPQRRKLTGPDDRSVGLTRGEPSRRGDEPRAPALAGDPPELGSERPDHRRPGAPIAQEGRERSQGAGNHPHRPWRGLSFCRGRELT
jgi:CheY-like chemotaxis protein